MHFLHFKIVVVVVRALIINVDDKDQQEQHEEMLENVAMFPASTEAILCS